MLSTLERCFYHDAKRVNTAFIELECITIEEHWMNVNVKKLEYFFANDGENILLSLRERLSFNDDVCFHVSMMEQKYFALELPDVQDYQNRSKQANEDSQQ